MAGQTPRDAVEDVIRDLDLVVYRLERPADAEKAARDRATVRRELERLRERLEEVALRL